MCARIFSYVGLLLIFYTSDCLWDWNVMRFKQAFHSKQCRLQFDAVRANNFDSARAVVEQPVGFFNVVSCAEEARAYLRVSDFLWCYEH